MPDRLGRATTDKAFPGGHRARRPALRSRLRLADVRGVAQLATQATIEVSLVVEGVHRSVFGSVGLAGSAAPGRAGGVTGLIYHSVRTITHWLGRGTDSILAEMQTRLATNELDGEPESPWRETVLAALNGVVGDRLAADGSPLATPMSLRHRGVPIAENTLQAGKVTEKIALMIHGLCMSDGHWRNRHGDPVVDHGEALAELGYTPIYLRYNSGRHVSENGCELAQLLEQLMTLWPVPVEEISVVAHSMGGLVIRSAAHQASSDALRWRKCLKNIVFVGTPHHGAPLERGGNLLDTLLGSTPYTAPFARLGRVRSAGITDLRHGNVLEDDWRGHDRFDRRADARNLLQLPENVDCFAIAATTATRRGLLADRLIGDGLVPLRSALGEHADPARALHFAKRSQWIAFRTGHNALLSSPEVGRKIVQWLSAQRAPGAAPCSF